MSTNTKRFGYYVNGVHYFGLDKRAQALAKARWLEAQYGRRVEVETVDGDFDPSVTGAYLLPLCG